jgi:hypothetical protein
MVGSASIVGVESQRLHVARNLLPTVGLNLVHKLVPLDVREREAAF